ncbi:MAG TPA: ABC transporter ATP-binding protein [Thermoanaerobaculia bacterium]|nr:ABC transporter ATP-binding protein [Thermoanaerobaculia bacterium]
MKTEAPQVAVEGVSLRYRLAKQRASSFKEYAIHWIKGSLIHVDLWALSDVSFEIARGERVAVIGRNGAGKSTLFKVLSRVLKPTQGRVAITGSVAPILELGTGFDPELTGWENIYLNALLLGHSRREVHERVDSIVDFSGLHDLIHSPIRNYSSGMVARLGFSIATAWQPDLLLLDEVLGVGDVSFLRKCKERLEQLREGGSTVLFVTHDPAAVEATSDRCLWLDHGRLVADGPTGHVLSRYLESSEHDARSL